MIGGAAQLEAAGAVMTLSATQAPGSNMGVYLLFAIAGLAAGGAWTAYTAGKKPLTFLAVVLAALAFAAGVTWMMGAMN